MPTDDHEQKPSADQAAQKAAAQSRPLTAAARRALAEAAARRAEEERKMAEQPRELSGRGGLDPVRYGDWEIKGLTSDF